MKKNYLLKSVYGRVGWGLFLLGAVYLVLIVSFVSISFPAPEQEPTLMESLVNHDFSDELGTIAVMIGLILITFSAERDEDEFTDALRLRSWYIAGISYAVVYIFCDLLIYEFIYLWYMWFIQGGLLFLLYIIIFKTKLYLSRRACDGQQS